MSDKRGEKRNRDDSEHEKYLEALRRAKANHFSEIPSIADKFADKNSTVDEQLNEGTQGRQSLNDYRRKRERIQRDMGNVIKPSLEDKKKTIVPPKKSILSFRDDESEEEEEDLNPTHQKKQKTEFQKRKFGKDPNVDTSFLPDKERDEEEQREKERALIEWQDQQERIKEEQLKVDYCYYDGTSHQKSYSIKKGTHIKYFVEEAKLNFPELKGVTTDRLIFVKEGFIIPHSTTFYHLICAPVTGLPAMLDWSFTPGTNQVGEINRLAKIVSRDFYERNKHNYPLNEWKPYGSK